MNKKERIKQLEAENKHLDKIYGEAINLWLDGICKCSQIAQELENTRRELDIFRALEEIHENW